MISQTIIKSISKNRRFQIPVTGKSNVYFPYLYLKAIVFCALFFTSVSCHGQCFLYTGFLAKDKKVVFYPKENKISTFRNGEKFDCIIVDCSERLKERSREIYCNRALYDSTFYLNDSLVGLINGDTSVGKYIYFQIYSSTVKKTMSNTIVEHNRYVLIYTPSKKFMRKRKHPSIDYQSNYTDTLVNTVRLF